MNLTDYHAKYFAHELTKRCASERLSGNITWQKSRFVR
jgi:hypothetical protein